MQYMLILLVISCYSNMTFSIGIINNAMIKIHDIFYFAQAYCWTNYVHNVSI